MNATPPNQKTASFLGILGAFLVVAGLVAVMKYYVRPAPLNQARAEERRKALAELRAANAQALSQHEWLDQGKGIVHLAITNAMELTVKEYQNPAAARSNLVARAEKASTPPPKPPEVPSKYE